ncbi:SAS complex subunit [Elasticomyces elasticus]|nr:SAS complex subunit [Elasticomyces elasticus]
MVVTTSSIPPRARSPDVMLDSGKATMEPNIANVILGNLLIKPWYQSFYPEELVGKRTERLDWEGILMHRSKKVCPQKDETPPGCVIYEKDEHAVHELDGEDHQLYTQNLSLFAKLFLETKSVFYDVTTFRYYTLVHTDPRTSQSQVVGFFSKEKMSWDDNNLACILVFPPWQKRGLGQILMGLSYELGRREGRLGGPERPLSALGRRGYMAFWSAAIYRYILSVPSKRSLTVRTLSEAIWIMPDDVIAALKEMEVVEFRTNKATPKLKGATLDKWIKKEVMGPSIDKASVKAWGLANGVGLVPPVDVNAFVEVEEMGQ